MKKKRQFERITDMIARDYGVVPEHLWRIYPEYAVFRNPHGGKWFGLIMGVPAQRLGLGGDNIVYVLNVHIAPNMVATILPSGRFLPGYHMNKASWTSILLDEKLSDAEIMPIIHASYESVTK